jgi:ATP-binding cassette subfamily A (ABC1) protein 5
MHPNKKYEEVPDIELNPLDKSILSNLILGYTPVTNITSDIMQRVSTVHLSDGIMTLHMYFIYNMKPLQYLSACFTE